MAKMMFENLNAIVANTLTDSIKMIDIDELHESEDNFFDINRIEEFAETILGQGGVKDNLIVRPLDTGGYEIISGHRRKVAVQYLLDKGENISRYLPCLVQNYDDNDNKILDIVLMNISSRQISDAEMWKSYEIVDRILKNKKSAGEKFGRIRDKLAECLGVSPTQVHKMQNIEKNAIASVKDAIQKGDISISTANEIAKLDDDEQEKIINSAPKNISHKNIKKMNDDKKSVTCNTNSKNDTTEFDGESEKCVTCNTNLESDTAEFDDESKKCGTNTTFSEDSKAEPTEKKSENALADFIHEHYFDLESIFTAYIGLTDNTDEIEILEDFQKLLYQVKEYERNKVRFCP